MLQANLEGPASGFAAQLGYCQKAGTATERFYYVAASPPVAVLWPGSWTPQIGTEYQFEITRGSTVGQPGKIVFRIVKTATGSAQEVAITHSWSDDLDGAWWGGETLDTESVHGTYLSQLDATETYMQYQTETGGLTQRSNMSGTDCCDVVITAGTPSDRHGKIKDGNYPGSVLKVWTED